MNSIFTNTIDVEPSPSAKKEKWVVYQKGDIKVELSRICNVHISRYSTYHKTYIQNNTHYVTLKIIIEPQGGIDGSKRKSITIFRDVPTIFSDKTKSPNSEFLPGGRMITHFDKVSNRVSSGDVSMGELIANNPDAWVEEQLTKTYGAKDWLEDRVQRLEAGLNKYKKQLKFINHGLAQL